MVYTRTCGGYAIGYVWNFPYNGSDGADGTPRPWSAPCTGRYKFETWGAQGGIYERAANYGANGGYSSGIINLNINTNLSIYVGGKGGNRVADTSTGPLGGWNGGSQGGESLAALYWGAPSGGGATDIRFDNSLHSRILVAGGAGGQMMYGAYDYAGYGGGLSGGNGYVGWKNYSAWASTNYVALSKGATQTTGYSFGYAEKGLDGNGGSNSAEGDCGNGGGYFGGYTSDAKRSRTVANVANGSGGSSYISGYKGCVAIISASSTSPRKNSSGTTCTESLAASDVSCSYHYSGYIFTDTVMKAGNESMPAPGGGNETGHSGNGYARITIVE